MKITQFAMLTGLVLGGALAPATSFGLSAQQMTSALNLSSRQDHRKLSLRNLIDEEPTLLYHTPMRENHINEYFGERSEMQPGEVLQSSNAEGLVQNVGLLRDLFGGPRGWDEDDWDGPFYPNRRRGNGEQGTASIPLPPVNESTTIVAFNHEDMKNPLDWKVRYFDVVVVVNKSAPGQFMKVYRKDRGATLPQVVRFNKTVTKNGRNLTLTTALPLVSTGRENAEMSNADRAACQEDNNCEDQARDMRVSLRPDSHAPSNSYFSQTAPGYYTPQWLSIDHVSAQWEDAAMDHAIFFHDGIALHRAPSKYESRLGTRASGACVRLSQNHAKELFWLVRSTGGPFREGELRQGRRFWFASGSNARWSCTRELKAEIVRNRNYGYDGDNVRESFEDCRRRVEQYLPKDCSRVRDQAQCLELEKNLPWRCYTARMKADPAAQLTCLADERSRILNKTKPIFDEEKVIAAERGWIPYPSQASVVIPEFDRFTGRPTGKMVPGGYKTLIVVENRPVARAR